MARAIARMSEALRWPFQMVPNLCWEFLTEKWKVILPYLSQRAAIAGARATAEELVEAGEVQIVVREKGIGFQRLDILKKGYARDHEWCLDLWNIVHYEGGDTKPPDLSQIRRARFNLRSFPHPKGDPAEAGSHVEMIVY